MKLTISKFAGMMPAVPPHLLPDNYATATLNAYPRSGVIWPLREPVSTIYSAGNTINSWALFPFDNTKTIERTDSADIVRGPIANDAYNRVSSAGDGGAPLVHYESGGSLQTIELGIDPPSKPAISYSWNSATPGDPSIPIYRSVYYVTNITAMGEESEPSDVSIVINRWDAASVPITLNSANDARAVKRRIYRSDGDGIFQFVTELTAATPSYSDTRDSADLTYECVSEEFNPPPDGLSGLGNAGNGILVGYFGNTVCFCEPFYPHAWPIDYQYSIPDEVVGISTFSGAILITTDSKAYIFRGTHPSSMSVIPLDFEASNLSRFGIVDMGEFALYPSYEGLMMISSAGAEVVTRQIFTSEQWQALDPSSFRAYRYHNAYLCFSSTGSFIFDLETGYWPFELTAVSSDQVISGHFDAPENRLYLLVKHTDNTRSVLAFDEGELKTMEWQSREFVMPANANLTAARVDSDEDSVFSITGNTRGSSIFDAEFSVVSDKGFRLPPGKPDRIVFKVSSAGRVNVVTLASSLRELV